MTTALQYHRDKAIQSCPTCHVPVSTAVYCTDCGRLQTTRHMTLYQTRKAQGLCPRCAIPILPDAVVYCPACLEYKRVAQHRVRQKCLQR